MDNLLPPAASRPGSCSSSALGNSHARGCPVEIVHLVGKSYDITGTVMPGARSETITSLADKEISNPSREDIVWSGANDINSIETKIGYMHIRNFFQYRTITNVQIMTASHRYDLKESSYIKKEIQEYNCKLKKIM
jgi:hypothetical protein